MRGSRYACGVSEYSALPKKAALYTMKTSSEQRLSLPWRGVSGFPAQPAKTIPRKASWALSKWIIAGGLTE
jgi:hypothetical protein